jgi:hypothetical protein
LALPLVLALNGVKWRVERPFYPYHDINSLPLFKFEHSFSTFIIAQNVHTIFLNIEANRNAEFGHFVLFLYNYEDGKIMLTFKQR